MDREGRRGCFVQLTSIEEYSMAGQVVMSPEAYQVLGDQTWEVMKQADGRAAVVVGPRVELPIPVPSVSHVVRMFKSSLSSNAVPHLHGAHTEREAVAAPGLHNMEAVGADSKRSGLAITRRLSIPSVGPIKADLRGTAAGESHTDEGEVPAQRSGLADKSVSTAGKQLRHLSRSVSPRKKEVLLEAAPGVSTKASASARSSVPHSDAGKKSPSSSFPKTVAKSMGSTGGDEEDERMLRRLLSALRMMVPGCVRGMIEDGNLDFINEIRPLTCLYLGFPSLSQEEEVAPQVPLSREVASAKVGDVAVEQTGQANGDAPKMLEVPGIQKSDIQLLTSKQLTSVQFVVQQSQEVMRKWGGSCLQVGDHLCS
jgi:hypothetical protein